MHIITVINYEEPKALTMSKIWLYLVRRFHPEAKLTVFTECHADRIAPAVRKAGASLVALDLSGLISHRNCFGFTHPSQDLIFGIRRYIDGVPGFGKYIYVEPDAWILGDLSEWWQVADEKPYIAVIESEHKWGRLFNTGTYSCRNDGFVTYQALVEQHQRDREIKLPVGEQGLMNAYLRHKGYDGSHQKIGFEYNCWTVGMKTERVSDQEIVIVSGDLPQHPISKVQSVGWRWFGMSKRVKILHSFFVKFWELEECRRLWDYLAEKVS